MLVESIENGKALAKLKEFVTAQGGDETCIDHTDAFPKAEYIFPVLCPQDGYVAKIHTENIGIIAMELGAGRATKEDTIDLAVGIVLNKKRGDRVEKGDVLAYVHANDEPKGEKAAIDILRNYFVSATYDEKIPLIYDVIEN